MKGGMAKFQKTSFRLEIKQEHRMSLGENPHQFSLNAVFIYCFKLGTFLPRQAHQKWAFPGLTRHHFLPYILCPRPRLILDESEWPSRLANAPQEVGKDITTRVVGRAS